MRLTNPRKLSFIASAMLLAVALSAGPTARANVYASNIKLNGNLRSVTNAQGASLTISFILNEPATLGTAIKILSGTNTVDTISVSSGSAGTLKGTNAVVWGGTNSVGANVAGGTYSVSITAASSGYTNWTQTTTDTNPGNYAVWPAGIAVDCNTNSLYYGRIMVANSGQNPGGTNFGDADGIIKLNADASFADEGQGSAGYAFIYDGNNGDIPRRGRIASDDRFYFDDWSGNGKIVAVDMLMTTNQVILDSLNFTGTDAAGNFSEIDVADVGTTNAKAYMADYNFTGVGLWVWPITNNGAADPTDDGVQLIQQGGTDIPERSVFGLMLDENQDIFIGDVRSNSGDTAPRASCITNWPSSIHKPLVSDNVFWQVGQADNTFEDISDLAIDARTGPHFVACAMNGGAGGIRILNATNGNLVTNLQQGTNAFFLSVGWDNVGNVYGGDAALTWRAFSPPGTNQATTVAVETIQVSAPPTPLQITSIQVSGGVVTINFTGAASDSPTNLFVLSSATAIPASSYSVVGRAGISQISPGVFQATLGATGSVQFYRIER